MNKIITIYDSIKVTSAALLETDRFNLGFSDGSQLTLTLRQVRAIRHIPSASSVLAAAPIALLPIVA